MTLTLACILIAFSAYADDDDGTSAATPEDTGGEQGSGCAPAERPAPKDATFARPKQRLQPGKTYVATVTTSCGTFGSGGPGYSIVERPPAKLSYSKGVVAMATTGLDRAVPRAASSSSSPPTPSTCRRTTRCSARSPRARRSST